MAKKTSKDIKNLFSKNKMIFGIVSSALLIIIITLIIFMSKEDASDAYTTSSADITAPSAQGAIVERDNGAVCFKNLDCANYSLRHCEGDSSNVRCGGDSLCHCCVVSKVSGACEGCTPECTGDRYCLGGVCVSKTGGKISS